MQFTMIMQVTVITFDGTSLTPKGLKVKYLGL